MVRFRGQVSQCSKLIKYLHFDMLTTRYDDLNEAGLSLTVLEGLMMMVI